MLRRGRPRCTARYRRLMSPDYASRKSNREEDSVMARLSKREQDAIVMELTDVDGGADPVGFGRLL